MDTVAVEGEPVGLDGEARALITSLEEQVLKPIQDPNEMDLTLAEAAARIQLRPEEISRALASFVRSILSGGSPFDRYINGDRAATSRFRRCGKSPGRRLTCTTAASPSSET
jgi:cytochrome c peroxidase